MPAVMFSNNWVNNHLELFVNIVCAIYIFAGLGIAFITAMDNAWSIFKRVQIIEQLFCYGKALSASSFNRCLHVPKRFFLHFYITATISAGVTLCCACLAESKFGHFKRPVKCSCVYYYFNDFSRIATDVSIAIKVTLFIILCQVIKRLYENIFVQVFSNNKMSMVHYLAGHFFYVTMPPLIYCCDEYPSKANITFKQC